MKIVKSNKRQPAVSFIGAILTIGFGVLWTLMVHRFISIVGGFGPMGILFPLIGAFFMTVGIIQLTIFINNCNHRKYHTDDMDYFDPSSSKKYDFDLTGKLESLSHKYWGDSKEHTKFIHCKNCNEVYDETFAYCPKCGKSKSD